VLNVARRVARRLDPPKTSPRPRRATLDEIGLQTGTDKSSALHDYLAVYDATFAHLRDKPIQLVEIGVHKGSSLRMWEEYFPRARLFGIDISPDCQQYTTERATVLIGDQSKPQFLDQLARKLWPTILIDDGSHVWRHQIETLQTLLPMVRPGGFFVVEDIHTSFGEDYAKVYGRDRSTETAFDYLQRIASEVTAGPRAGDISDDFIGYCRQAVESVQFIRNAAILRKREYPQRKYRVRSVGDIAEEPYRRDAGVSYARIPAELVGADDSVLAAFDRLQGDGTVQVPSAVSGELSNARVVGSGLVTVGSSIIDETLNCARNLQRSSGLYQVVRGSVWVDELPSTIQHKVPTIDGKRHVLLKQTWDANYGHWMIDTLPKVGLLREFEDVSRCLFVLNEQPTPAMRQVVKDSLGLFGITPEQLVFLGKDSYEFERLTVLGTLSRHPVTKTPLAIEILEELARQVPPAEAAERLYVSRRGTTRRRLTNEDAVVELLSGRGYRVFAPQDLSVADQIATFRGATHVVGVMGAALANLAFCPRGVSVLSLSTPAMKHDYFYDIVCLKQGYYRGLQGSADSAEKSLASDFSVDLDRLAEALDWLHSEKA
jgi:capsular polysaccharide biosynthesis protein